MDARHTGNREHRGDHGIVIELLAAGVKPPAWIEEGVAEYRKRLPRDWRLEIREIPVARRGSKTQKGAALERLKDEEGRRMLDALQSGARVVALDLTGAIWSTETLAGKFNTWTHEYSHVHFLIGGPDGLSRDCLNRADDVWSLSKLTFPHFVVRLLLAEQIYRAWAICNGHPYHK